MNVTVIYYGQARSMAGVDRENIDVEEKSSINDVVRTVIDNHDKALRKLLFTPDGVLRKSILILIDDEVAETGCPGVLRENDKVSIIMPLSGG